MCFVSPFAPTLAAATSAAEKVQLADYARTRNFLDGAVTRLSPYLTHGFLSLPEVLRIATRDGPIEAQHKFIFELGWREYYRHVWMHRRDGIFDSLHPGILPDQAYAPELPLDIREARTGIPAIDLAVRMLYQTGYIHNHARMWLASYVVHLRKIHWRAGADWMYAHLLDGDLASNALSWQWVSGTGSTKPYLFNAENVARYAPPPWHSFGTVIDTSYESLDQIARQTESVLSPTAYLDGTTEPQPQSTPPHCINLSVPNPEFVRGRSVYLVHPWLLGELPRDLPSDVLKIGIFPRDFHSRWPWSEQRWLFVHSRMAEITPHCWFIDQTELTAVMQPATNMLTTPDSHSVPYLPHLTQLRSGETLFPSVDQRCDSFSKWWNRVNRASQTSADLLNRNLQPCLL